jgi:hypothetical protein
MRPEERVFFARTTATFDVWGSNDQKPDYQPGGPITPRLRYAS